jgi:hypothetical protein
VSIDFLLRACGHLARSEHTRARAVRAAMTLYESCVRRNALLNTALFDLLLLIMSQVRRVSLFKYSYE